MKPILVLAPHLKMARTAEAVAARYPEVRVEFALLEDALDRARKAVAAGTDVLISRGGTAKMLEEGIPDVPVIELPVSAYDLLSAVHKARELGDCITVIGFERVLQGIDRIADILGIDLTVHRVEKASDAGRLLRRLLSSGARIDVLMGGALAEALALKHGIPTVFLETSASTIENSIKEARRVASVRNSDRQKTEQYRAVLHYINQGVVAVDRAGNVTTFNPAASKITGVRAADVIGRRIDRFFPGDRTRSVIERGQAELGQLESRGGKMILANRVPILVKGQPVGAVETFEDVTIIQAYEEKIRSKMSEKGHVARYHLKDIVGDSRPIREAKRLAEKYAAADSTVLITGESGTGKEMFAQGIHNLSRRRAGPFVALNCAAIPESLLESELFGYEEGAFTGARKHGKLGRFAIAHRGTLFLDEVSEMPCALQARLLRVLQEKQVVPLGSERVVPVDVRIIAATNRNLLDEVRRGAFRKDLYYRLGILVLRVPALAERPGDIRRLAEHFIRLHAGSLGRGAGLTRTAAGLLERYRWPGNIRELENLVERWCVVSSRSLHEGELRGMLEELGGQDGEAAGTIEGLSRAHARRVLEASGGNRTEAARRLGVSRTTLWRMLKSP